MIGGNAIWDLMEPNLFAGFLLMLRIYGLVLMLPGMSSGGKPIPTRALFVAFLTVFCLMALGMPRINLSPELTTIVPILICEFLIGASLGLSIRMLFAVAEACGSIVGMSMALSMAGMIDPLTGEQSTAISNILAIGGTLLFVSLGGHHQAVTGLMNNLNLFPLGQAKLVGYDPESLQMMGRGLLTAAFQVAAPILIVTTIINVGLGLMARAAPQINIFAVGFGVLLISGMLLLDTTIVSLHEIYEDRIKVLPESMNENLRGLY
jgi:flagellar biosynthetic protein FliR